MHCKFWESIQIEFCHWESPREIIRNVPMWCPDYYGARTFNPCRIDFLSREENKRWRIEFCWYHLLWRTPWQCPVLIFGIQRPLHVFLWQIRLQLWSPSLNNPLNGLLSLQKLQDLCFQGIQECLELDWTFPHKLLHNRLGIPKKRLPFYFYLRSYLIKSNL